MSTKEECIEKLDKILLLEEDWNGYGAPGFDESYINMVKEILESLDHYPDIYPTGLSSVQFEYDTKQEYLEIEIKDNSSGFLYVPRNNDFQLQFDMAIEGSVKNDSINKLINKLMTF